VTTGIPVSPTEFHHLIDCSSFLASFNLHDFQTDFLLQLLFQALGGWLMTNIFCNWNNYIARKFVRTKNKAHWVINLITVKVSNSSAFLTALYKQVWSNLFCVWFFFFPLNFLLGFSEPNAHKCVSFHSLKYTQYSLMEPTEKQKHFSYGSSYISLPSLM